MEENEKYKYTYFDLKKSNSVSKSIPTTADLLLLNKSESTCGSQWNACGTWEEKRIDIEKLKQHLSACIEKSALKDIISMKLLSLSGEASIVYSRKKRKVGYELKGEVSVETGDSGKATLKFENFCDDSGEDPIVKI